MGKVNTCYAVIRIDYESKKNVEGWEVADIVVNNALAHIHTIENGIRIENIENCGLNL